MFLAAKQNKMLEKQNQKIENYKIVIFSKLIKIYLGLEFISSFVYFSIVPIFNYFKDRCK